MYVQAAGANQTITNNVTLLLSRFIVDNATVAGQAAGNLTLSGSVLMISRAVIIRTFTA